MSRAPAPHPTLAAPRRDRAARAAIALIALALMPVAGCGLTPKWLATPRASRAPAWPFAPARLHIHPLTRIVPDPAGGPASIEAHIELVDRAGDEVKGVGRLLLELYRESGPVRGVGEQAQLLRWTVDLSDPERNASAYDRVTRTYRVLLTQVPASALDPERLLLRALLITPDDRQLAAVYRLGERASAAATP